MKVVLFCGGLGTRLGDIPGRVPKPMVNIGFRPILWHLMKYYAHFGHKDFILCLGYKADVIKQFFLDYDPCLSSDFTIQNGRKEMHIPESDIADWRITCVDTGLRSNIGQRLRAVEKYVKDDEYFLANYADGLSDLPLPVMIDSLQKSQKVASFICVKPSQSFSVVSLGNGGAVERLDYVRDTNITINGGYFVLRNDIFRYLNDGEELVVEAFARLIKENKLLGYPYNGFWYCMDTFKEQQELNDMFEHGNAPWVLWNAQRGRA
jgi:glucose-1-phosphate cytidylyltransferase